MIIKPSEIEFSDEDKEWLADIEEKINSALKTGERRASFYVGKPILLDEIVRRCSESGWSVRSDTLAFMKDTEDGYKILLTFSIHH